MSQRGCPRLWTGWAHQLDLAETRLAGIGHVVAKPIDVDGLAATIQTALARRGSGVDGRAGRGARAEDDS